MRTLLGTLIVAGLTAVIGCGSSGAQPADPVPESPPKPSPLSAGSLKKLEEAQAATRNQDWRKAVALLHEARSDSPDNPTVLRGLATTWQAAGNPLAAMAWYNAFAAATGEPESHEEIGRHNEELKAEVREHMRACLVFGLTTLINNGALLSDSHEDAVLSLASIGELERAHNIMGMVNEIGEAETIQHYRCKERLIEGLVTGGRYDEAIKTAVNLYKDESQLTMAWLFELQTNLGDYEGAKRWLALRSNTKRLVSVAATQALTGHVDDAWKSLLLVQDDSSQPNASTWQCNLLLHGSAAAISKFIKAHSPEVASRRLYGMIAAMIDCGYLTEAEHNVSIIPERAWQSAAKADIINAKADLKQLSRAEQISQLKQLVVDARELPLAWHFTRLSLAKAYIVAGDLAAARQLAYEMKSNAAGDSAKMYSPYWLEAFRLLMVSQAEAGDFNAAQQTTQEMPAIPRAAGTCFLRAAQYRGEKIAGEFSDAERRNARFVESMRSAAKVQALRGNVAMANTIIATFCSARDRRSGTSPAAAMATVAAAAFRRGDRAAAREIARRMLATLSQDMDNAWYFDDDLVETALELARVGDVEDLKELVELVLRRPGRTQIVHLGHCLSQLQEALGDVAGAKETRRQTSRYFPSSEVSDWSAIASSLEKSAFYQDGFDAYFKALKVYRPRSAILLSGQEDRPDERTAWYAGEKAIQSAGGLRDILLRLECRIAFWRQKRAELNDGKSPK